jgi:transcriptional regulator with XRE-family HTH domain
MLGWSQKELAEKAGLGFATVQRSEQNPGAIMGMVETVYKLRSAFENAGVAFIDADDHGGPGVRLRQGKP